MIRVKRYTPEAATLWNSFASDCKNATFMHQRTFIEYHHQPFVDHSLLFFVKDELTALLPANQNQNSLFSHQGLTYGGLLVKAACSLTTYLTVFDALLDYCEQNEIAKVTIKLIPRPYVAMAADEDLYVLFLLQARLVGRHNNAMVRPASNLKMQKRRERGAKKASGLGIQIKKTAVSDFWPMLEQNLARHEASPVHSLKEMTELISKFANNISIYGAFEKNELLAGVLIFETNRVARSQYIASTEAGREKGALDLLFSQLLTQTFVNKPWFDFGTSTREGGRQLVLGISEQKEGFGARSIVQDTYEIDISDRRLADFIS